MTTRARDVSAALRRRGNRRKAIALRRFFKTGAGEYAEGDRFIGVSVPQQRILAKKYAALALGEIKKLLRSPVHEERLTALLIMVGQYRRADAKQRAAIYRTYLRHTRFINNWDLVDNSAPYILGPHIAAHPRPVLEKLIRSPSLWERRIGVLATFHFILNGRARETLWVASQLIADRHDLVHKAVGWMLRETGKRVEAAKLRKFLDRYAHRMPRTMLRYAIERFSPDLRRTYLAQTARRAPRGG